MFFLVIFNKTSNLFCFWSHNLKIIMNFMSLVFNVKQHFILENPFSILRRKKPLRKKSCVFIFLNYCYSWYRQTVKNQTCKIWYKSIIPRFILKIFHLYILLVKQLRQLRFKLFDKKYIIQMANFSCEKNQILYTNQFLLTIYLWGK